ncbi:MAG TPA: C45 family peptidase [Bacillota bacterium]|nr:C45 family peptidase [Bacillota bacterium]
MDSFPEATKTPLKKKLRFKIVSIGFASLFLFLVIAFLVYGNSIRSILTFRRIGNENLYTMTYYGGYGFGDYLKKGMDPNQNPTFIHQKEWACSAFSARNEKGNPLLGRNFDFYHRSAMLLFTDPPDGYNSVSLVDMYYLGYGPPNYTPASYLNRINLLDAPRFPFDGMNECGLAIGMMAIPESQDSINPEKITINQIDAIRMVLDYAKDVEEALSLFKKYNVVFISVPIHYLIADAKGHSVVVEFLKGKMEILRSPEPWQVATNFQIINTPGVAQDYRYITADETLRKSGGVIKEDNAMHLLRMEISQPNTMWSVVYNLTTGDIQVAMGLMGYRERMGQMKKFKLRMRKKG